MKQLREQGIKLLHSSFEFTDREIQILRRNAEKVAVYAEKPEMKRKARLWRAHNDLLTDEPLVFIDPENGWDEIITENDLECEDPLARAWEKQLKKLIFWAEHLKDDKVVEAYFDVPYSYWDTGWGLDICKIGGEHGNSYYIKTAIEDYESDFEKIHHPEIIVDQNESDRILELAEKTLGDILTVRRKQDWWWSLGMCWDYIDLRGLENFMCDFLLEPEWVERMFALLFRGKMDMIDFLEKNSLLSQNTGGSYVGSGGFGYTSQIKTKGKGEQVFAGDMWGFCESQETVSVDPELYGKFIFLYHKKILERFALNCYGCCEPYDPRWKFIKQLPKLRRVSVSPWAKWYTVPEWLGKDYVASVKPSPTPLAMRNMNEDVVRKDCRKAVEETKGGICEFIMKDNHTLGNNPQNAVRWVEIMREEIDRVYG